MSKPKTKGAVIGVRLPLAVDTEIRKRAELRDVTPAVYVEQILISAVERNPTKSVRNRSATPVKDRIDAKVACVHKEQNRLGTGLWVCKGCGATSRDRGLNWIG